MEWLESAFNSHTWIFQIVLTILIGLFIILVELKIYNTLHKKASKTSAYWDISLLEAIQKPLMFLLILATLFLSARVAMLKFKSTELLSFTSTLDNLLIIMIILWFLFRLVSKLEFNINKYRPGKYDKTTLYVLGRLSRLLILIIGLMFVMQVFGIPISGLVAFGGGGAIVVGLAAKDLLANFFGGMMIFLDRPFKIGDWISSPDKQIEGTVEHIGWRLTRIRTFDKRPLYVPNSIFSTIAVLNPSRMTNRRIKTNIGVRYDDALKVRAIVKAAEEMIKSHPDIDQDQTIFVNLVNFAPSSLEFTVYCFTKTTNWVEFQRIQEDVFLKIIDIIHEHKSECAFPTTTIHIPEEIHVQQGVEIK